MKKINDGKKLQLNTETIQTLTPNDLEGAVGGAQKPIMISSQHFVCTAQPRCCPIDA